MRLSKRELKEEEEEGNGDGGWSEAKKRARVGVQLCAFMVLSVW